MVAQTRHGGPSKKRLAFHEKLLPKGINTDGLLKKLKTLHTQLASLDQDTVDTASLNTARAELIHHSLLLHKDRGVKAYTACCLADILRLYAPEAPYTQAELRDIFQFFFRQLSAGLKGQDELYYNEYYHLLESLSTVKSVVLVCDFPSADEILQDIFRDLFTVVKRDLTKKVELFMADILVALIDESTSFPSEALDILMAQFKDKNAKNDNPSYRLATQVCHGAADKLQRHVCQYFGDLLTSTSADEEQEEDIDTIRTAHDLIKQLQRACPTVLHSVIPILEAELRSESLNPRIIATQTLGEMYGEKTGQDLVRKYPTTWTAWLNRKSDIAVPVRLKCVEAIPPLFISLPEQATALDDLLKAKFFDHDERVRAATCKLFSQLDYETALNHISKEHLELLVGRGMDKKASVRKEALNSAGKIYNMAYPEIANNEHSAVQHFAWIPHEILGMASTSFDLRALVETVVADYILPLPLEKDIDEGAWADRLLTVMRYLTPKSTNLLVVLSNVKANRPTVFEVFVDACEQNNGGIIDGDRDAIERRLKLVIQHISSSFPDKTKTIDDLNAFAKLNENRLYKLLKTLMDPQTDLKGLVRASNDFLKRLEQLSSSLVPTMAIILRRSSYRMVNQSAVPFLLKYLAEALAPTNEDEQTKRRRSTMTSTRTQYAAINSLTLLVTIAKNNAAMLRPHLGELTKILAESGTDDRRESFGTVNAGSNVEVALMALANLAKTKEGTGLAGTAEKHINQRVVRLALDSDWRQAKFATRYLTLSANKDEICAQLVEQICAKINDQRRTEPLPVSYISALVQLVRFAPQAFEAESETIMTHLVKRVIMTPIPAGEDNEEEWIENDDMPDELRAKIQALKVCRYRTLSHASSEDALKMAAPVLKLLATILEHDGTLNPDVEEDAKAKTRMRLQAAVSLLHLATVPTFAAAIQPKFVRLACTIQDSCFDARHNFLTKLILLLQPRKLPPGYNVIPFLTMLDPEQDIRVMATAYVEGQKTRITTQMFTEYFELTLVRLLHLLAHHPDFATTQEELVDMAGYVNFYIEQVASERNVSLLYHLAQKGKCVRDPESHSRSEKFYIMCDIAQLLIRTKAQANSWPVDAYPGKIKLPSDILKPLPSADAVNQIQQTMYLSLEATQWLTDKYGGAGKDKEKKEKEKKERKERVPTKRKTAPTKSNGSAKRPRRKRSDSDDSDEDVALATSEAGSDVEMEDGTTRTKPAKQSREERLNARLKAKEKSSKKDDEEEDEED